MTATFASACVRDFAVFLAFCYVLDAQVKSGQIAMVEDVKKGNRFKVL